MCLLLPAFAVGQNKLKSVDESYLKKAFVSEKSYTDALQTRKQLSKKKENPDLVYHILELTTCEGGFSYFFGDCYGTNEEMADLKALPPLTSSEFEKGTTMDRIEIFKSSYAYLKLNSSWIKKKPFIDMNLNSLRLEFIRQALYIQRTTQNKSADRVADELIDLYKQENEQGVGTEGMDVILDILRMGKSEKVKAFCKGKYFSTPAFYDEWLRKAYEKAGDKDFQKYLKKGMYSN
jgi:hypothetical protein